MPVGSGVFILLIRRRCKIFRSISLTYSLHQPGTKGPMIQFRWRLEYNPDSNRNAKHSSTSRAGNKSEQVEKPEKDEDVDDQTFRPWSHAKRRRRQTTTTAEEEAVGANVSLSSLNCDPITRTQNPAHRKEKKTQHGVLVNIEQRLRLLLLHRPQLQINTNYYNCGSTRSSCRSGGSSISQEFFSVVTPLYTIINRISRAALMAYYSSSPRESVGEITWGNGPKINSLRCHLEACSWHIHYTFCDSSCVCYDSIPEATDLLLLRLSP